MRRLAWVLLALIAAWLIFVGGGWLGIYTTELRVATVSLAGLVLAGWAIVSWRDPAWRPRSVMAPAIAACLGSMAIATIFSRVPRVSLEYLGYAILLAALYLLLVQLMSRPFFRQRLLVLAGGMFIAVSVEYIAYVVYLWIQWWGNVGHIAVPPLRPNFVSLTYGNPSAALTISALFAVPAAAKWSSWSPRGILAFFAVGLVVGVMAILSGSRAGWLALAIAVVCGVLGAAVNAEVRTHLRGLLGRRKALPNWAKVALAIGAIVVVGLVGATLPGIVARAGSGGEEVRLGFYFAALRMFVSSPIVGTGLGTWVIQREAYTPASDADIYIPHAHDVPVQVLAEQGVVGAVAAVVLIVNLAVLLRSAGRSPDGDQRRWAWITALGLIYFAAHDLLDFYPNMPGILFAAAFPVAYLDATSSGEGQLAKSPPPILKTLGRAPLLVGVLLVFVATAGLLAQEIPSHLQDAALEAGNANDWQGAFADASSAASSDPAISPYAFTAGLAAAHLGDHVSAAAYFRQVAVQDDLPEAWLNLAAEQAVLGQNADAIASVARSLRLGIQHVQDAIPAGELARQLGARDLAVQAFAATIATTPSFAADPWWHADSDRASLLADAIAAASSQAIPDEVWEIALMAGDAGRALSEADAANDPDSARLFVLAWTGDDAAFQQLIDHCVAEPLNLNAQGRCARIENHRGNESEAGRFRDLMDALSGGSSFQGLELRVLTSDVRGPYAVASTTYGWFFYTYRRSGPLDMLEPSLVHIRFG
jgi:O-antigen ligase